MDEATLKERAAELMAERRERVMQLRSEGFTLREIATATGYSTATIHSDLTGAEEPQPQAPAERPAVPVSQLRSGSLPEGAVVEDEVDHARLADRILRRW